MLRIHGDDNIFLFSFTNAIPCFVTHGYMCLRSTAPYLLHEVEMIASEK